MRKTTLTSALVLALALAAWLPAGAQAACDTLLHCAQDQVNGLTAEAQQAVADAQELVENPPPPPPPPAVNSGEHCVLQGTATNDNYYLQGYIDCRRRSPGGDLQTRSGRFSAREIAGGYVNCSTAKWTYSFSATFDTGNYGPGLNLNLELQNVYGPAGILTAEAPGGQWGGAVSFVRTDLIDGGYSGTPYGNVVGAAQFVVSSGCNPQSNFVNGTLSFVPST